MAHLVVCRYERCSLNPGTWCHPGENPGLPLVTAQQHALPEIPVSERPGFQVVPLLFPSLAALSPVQISLRSILEKFMNFWCTDGDLLFLHRGILLAPNCCYLFGPFTRDLGEGETHVPITISN